MTFKNWVRFIALGLIWGTAFMWIKIVVHEINPVSLVAIRAVIALITSLVLLVFMRKPFPPFKKWWVFLFLGAFNMAFPFTLISWAEMRIPSAVAAIINGTVPLFTALIANLFLKEEVFTWRKFVGLLVGFSGVIILMSKGLSLPGGKNLLSGCCAMLVAALFYGSSYVFARKYAQGMHAVTQGLGQALSANVVMWSMLAAQGQPLQVPVTRLGWFALLFLGIFATGVAMVLSYSLVNSVGATKSSLVTYLFPVIGAVLGVTVLKEPFSWSMVVGCLVILIGVIIVNSQKPVQSVYE